MKTLDPGALFSPMREKLAYQHKDALVWDEVFGMDPRSFAGSPHVVGSLLREGARRLADFLSVGKPAEEVGGIVAFVEDVLSCHLELVPASLSREYFHAELIWAEALGKTPWRTRCIEKYESILNRNVLRFPDLWEWALVSLAENYNFACNQDKTIDLLGEFVTKPYVFTSPGKWMAAINIHTAALIALGRLGEAYASLAFLMKLGVSRAVSMDGASYRDFLGRCVRNIVGIKGVFFRAGLGMGLEERLMALIILIDAYLFTSRGRGGSLLGKLYYRGCQSLWLARHLVRAVLGLPRDVLAAPGMDEYAGCVLVTRVQGGAGDVLMMKPGVAALRRRYPGRRIVFLTAPPLMALFSEADGIEVANIWTARPDLARVHRWFNFSQCPAARYEGRHVPKIKHNRIALFARALGVALLVKGAAALPRFPLSKDEVAARAKRWQEAGLGRRPVIGVQLHSAERYRDYPFMEDLVRRLATRADVLVFHHAAVSGYEFDGVRKITNLSMRDAMALALQCDLIVAPDSSFVHLAGGAGIPCVALFGPTDGRIRTKEYASVRWVDVRTKLACIPCWRNEYEQCKLIGAFDSPCMRSIDVSDIESICIEMISS